MQNFRFVLLAFAFFGGLVSNVVGQSKAKNDTPFAKRNSLQLNALVGSAITGIGYQRLLYQSNRHKLFGTVNYVVSATNGSRAPFNFRREWSHGFSTAIDYSISIGRKTGNHHFDMGVNYTCAWSQILYGTLNTRNSNGQDNLVEDISWGTLNQQFLFPRIGYRYQKPQGGFTWQGGIYPFYYDAAGVYRPRLVFFPLPHASIGWSF
jgi:hypothetical protein